MPEKLRDNRYSQSLLSRLTTFAYGSAVVTAETKRLLRDLVNAGPIASIGDAGHDAEMWPPSTVASVQVRLREFFDQLMAHAESEHGGIQPELKTQGLTFGVTPAGGEHVALTVDGEGDRRGAVPGCGRHAAGRYRPVATVRVWADLREKWTPGELLRPLSHAVLYARTATKRAHRTEETC